MTPLDRRTLREIAGFWAAYLMLWIVALNVWVAVR